jgi:hypothetical protein
MPRWRTSTARGSTTGWRPSSNIAGRKSPALPSRRPPEIDSRVDPGASREILAEWRSAQRALRHLAIGSLEHSAAIDRIAQCRADYLQAIRDARRDERPEPLPWPMMSPRSQARLPIEDLVVDGERIPVASGSLTIVEQQSGRRDWRANALFAGLGLDRRQAEQVDVVIGTPAGTLRGRAIITGQNPFGITLAAVPGATDTWGR